MSPEFLLRIISKHKELPPDPADYFDHFTSYDINAFMCLVKGVSVSCPDDLEYLEEKQSLNLREVNMDLSWSDPFESFILQEIRQDAFSVNFDESVIRKALEKGFYPMGFQMDDIDFLSIRSHFLKCIITFDRFRVPKNTKKIIEKDFSDCILTFNKAYDQVIEALLSAHPENWLSPELLKVFKKIHENPDSAVSIDSVEIWRGDQLIAGELGFITGSAYASLTGFHKDNNSGTVQMSVLGMFLKENGFSYWDLGMSIPYKYRYGTSEFNKAEQKTLWEGLKKERIPLPQKEIPLADFLDKDFPSFPEQIDKERLMKFSKPDHDYACYGRQICRISDFMNVNLLYSAYMQGIFPWYSEDNGESVAWYSTDPRFVLMPEDFHCPKSLKKFLKHNPYTYTMDKCFTRVMEECRKMKRTDQDGTWIGKTMIETYTKFHKAGYAHSFEVWKDGKLCGGFYGVLIGSIFFGESMFTLEPDSSKSAFALFMEAFKNAGGIILDSQSYTENIARYGAKNISRDAFLRIEKDALYTPLKKDLKTEFLKISAKKN